MCVACFEVLRLRGHISELLDVAVIQLPDKFTVYESCELPWKHQYTSQSGTRSSWPEACKRELTDLFYI